MAVLHSRDLVWGPIHEIVPSCTLAPSLEPDGAVLVLLWLSADRIHVEGSLAFP